MEFILIVLFGFSLHIAGRYTSYLADQMAGKAFDELHEVIGHVSYFGQAAQPVQKFHQSQNIVPLMPALSHNLKVLSKTDCDHWFWFNAEVRMLKLTKAGLQPITTEEAEKILQDYPEIHKQFFTKKPAQTSKPDKASTPASSSESRKSA